MLEETKIAAIKWTESSRIRGKTEVVRIVLKICKDSKIRKAAYCTITIRPENGNGRYAELSLRRTKQKPEDTLERYFEIWCKTSRIYPTVLRSSIL